MIQKIDVWKIPKELKTPQGFDLENYTDMILLQIQGGNYEAAIKDLFNKREYCNSQNSINEACGFLSLLLAIAHRKVGIFNQALLFATHATSHFEAGRDKLNVIRCKLALGDVWRSKAKSFGTKRYFTKASKYYANAEDLLICYLLHQEPSITSGLLQVQVYWAQAKIAIEQQRPSTEMLNKLLDAWRTSEKHKSEWAKEECGQVIGRYYEMLGRPDDAVIWFRQAYNISLKTKSLDRHIENTISLARTELLLGNPSIALTLANSAKKSLVNYLRDSKFPKNRQYIEFLQSANRIIVKAEKNLNK